MVEPLADIRPTIVALAVTALMQLTLRPSAPPGLSCVRISMLDVTERSRISLHDCDESTLRSIQSVRQSGRRHRCFSRLVVGPVAALAVGRDVDESPDATEVVVVVALEQGQRPVARLVRSLPERLWREIRDQRARRRP